MNEKYSTIRIDTESKEKLRELNEQLKDKLGIPISLAATLKLIIDDIYSSEVKLDEKIAKRIKL